MMRKDDFPEDDTPTGVFSAAGQAALLLVESLLHELVAVGLLPLQRAAAVVEIAIDTAEEIALVRKAGREDWTTVSPLLQAIAHTLSLDAGDQAAGDQAAVEPS